MKTVLLDIYKKLYNRFGSQAWWPGETPFEIVVGAILTQNTAWVNVEKAIQNLKSHNVLFPKALSKTKTSRIAKLIRPSGYYNIKARRLRNFLNFLDNRFKGDLVRLFKTKTQILRRSLLGIKGIGPETADSILLYAAKKPIFVIDAYTRRIFSRHKLISEKATYEELQRFFMSNLPKSTKLYNEYHALIVRAGKDLCKKRPKCNLCPLKRLFITILCLFLWHGISYAQKGLYIENIVSYRYEIASDQDEDIFINRLSAKNLYGFTYKRAQWGISSFFELRQHLVLDKAYLKTLGISLDANFFKYLTFCSNFQYTWVDVPAGYFRKQRFDKDRFEISPVLGLNLPIWKAGTITTYLSAVDEYFYDIEHIVPLRNEIGVGFRFAINERFDIGCGWRHLDWVKDFDSDQVEALADIRF